MDEKTRERWLAVRNRWDAAFSAGSSLIAEILAEDTRAKAQPRHSGWLSPDVLPLVEMLPAHYHGQGGDDEFFCPNDCPRLLAVERILEDRAILPLVNQIRNRARAELRVGNQRLAVQNDASSGEPLTITITIGSKR